MAIKKLLIKTAVGHIVNHNKYKKIKQKGRDKKHQYRDYMVRRFGKARYYLALWFGPWILWTWNKKAYIK